MKYPETDSDICAGVVPRSCAICGNAGRYMSIENGLTVLSAPRIRIIKRPEWELRGIAAFDQVNVRPAKAVDVRRNAFRWWREASAQATAGRIGTCEAFLSRIV